MPLSFCYSRSWAVWPTHLSQNCFYHGLRAEQTRQLFNGAFVAEDNRNHPSHSTHVFTAPTYVNHWSKKKATNLTKSWGNVSTFSLHLHCLEFQWRDEVPVIKSTPKMVRSGKEGNARTLMVWKRGGDFCMANNLFSEYLFWLCLHGYAY